MKKNNSALRLIALSFFLLALMQASTTFARNPFQSIHLGEIFAPAPARYKSVYPIDYLLPCVSSTHMIFL